jgi:hypothetical protein
VAKKKQGKIRPFLDWDCQHARRANVYLETQQGDCGFDQSVTMPRCMTSPVRIEIKSLHQIDYVTFSLNIMCHHHVMSCPIDESTIRFGRWMTQVRTVLNNCDIWSVGQSDSLTPEKGVSAWLTMMFPLEVLSRPKSPKESQ